ncbi:partial Minor extracellular protease vpr, partial [Anaerolineae bacterium]
MKNLRSVRSLFILGLVLFLFVIVQVQPGAAQPAKEVGALLAQAQAQGSTRVIVGLRGGFQLDGRLARTAAESQRIAIAQAQDALLNQMATQNVQFARKFEFMPYLVMEVDANALAFLASSPSVASIVEDKPRAPSLAESTALIGATNAWASGYAGAGQTVAILDTGVDKTHSFLTNKVVSEACYSTTSTGVSSSVCPGGVNQSTAPGSGVNCDVTVEGCDHGTHVAGIAAGKDPGGLGFSGVARDANIIAIQVFSRFDSTSVCGSSVPCAMSWDSD